MSEYTHRTPADVIRSALRNEVEYLLSACTDKQQALFDRIYPEGLDGMDESALRSALALLQRTHHANALREGR